MRITEQIDTYVQRHAKCSPLICVKLQTNLVPKL